MKKITLLIISVLAIFSCIKTEKTKHPNVVLILSDDQGWGDLSMNGNSNINTPNIDKLAKSGVTFDRFYVCAVCSPTRAELLTGRYHVRGGVYSTSTGGERLDLDETTIAQVFKQAGYATAAYGKWHNGMQPPYHPNARGFDDFYGFCSGHWGNYFSPMLEHNGEIVTGNGYLTNDLTNHGIDFIEENKNRPFFLYLPFNIPHAPMQVPDRWWNEFVSKDLKMRNRDPEKEDLQFTKAALAMCENVDWNVGRLTSKIKELGLEDNTIIIYLSDNGPNSWRWNEGMKGRKGSTDEGGVRSPLCMAWQGKFIPGKKVTQIAGAIDLLPTLTDLAGIDFQPSKPLDGVSLKPLLMEGNPQWNERYIFNYWNHRTSVRSQKYRLDNTGQLFDMENDPGQYTNVADQYPEITKELLAAQNKWNNEVLGELPKSDNRPFPIGDPNFNFTQIPARDGVAHGNIIRSARPPNCSFFTNWTSLDDSITWETEVLAEGDFDVDVYYTCPAADTGAVFKLSFEGEQLKAKISEVNDPPLTGMENDRVKAFKPLHAGTIHLKKGKGTLTLKALEIRGSQLMDFRLMMFHRKE